MQPSSQTTVAKYNWSSIANVGLFPLGLLSGIRTLLGSLTLGRPAELTNPAHFFPGLYFFSDMMPFLAFSIASGRWGTAQERGARGLTRFRANEAKTCIFVFFEHFSELARTACGHVIRDTRKRLCLNH